MIYFRTQNRCDFWEWPSSDQDIWEYASVAGLTIVTQDSDFADMAAVFGSPPKVLWLRCGNQPTEYIEKLLRQHFDIIEVFESEEASGLEIY